MNVGMAELFWLFVGITMLQPWLRQKMLDTARVRLMHRIERQRKTRVVLLVHRQETISYVGLPFFQYIDVNDAEEVVRAIRLTDPEVPIDLVLHTPGGLVLASLQIARAVKACKGKVTVFVPHYAMSGGTLIALAAHQIVMGEHAVLGPVDPQLGEYPAASLVKVAREQPAAGLDDRTLNLADVAEKALRQIRAAVVELLADRVSPEKAAALADQLTQGSWTRDHPISFREAEALGLPVHGDLPTEFYQLMGLFPQPTPSQPAPPSAPTQQYQLPTPPGGKGW